MQPRPIAETSSPLFPNCRFSIVRLLPLCPLLSAFPNLAQFVGEISDGIVVAEGDEKIDVLKHNYYLNNEFYDLKHQKIEYGVEKSDQNVLSRYCGLLYILHDFLPLFS
jgi:hypothetical protein